MVSGQAPQVRHVRSRQVASQAEVTRSTLIAAARRLFVDKGYFATGTEEIVRAADVTRGALYHHFANKEALFLAVFEAVEDDLMAKAATATTTDSLTRLRAGLLGFLDASLTREVQQVLLLDGPTVLGWQQWRDIESRYGLGAIASLLTTATNEGTLRAQPVEPLANLLLAALHEAALFIANAPNKRRARDASVTAMETLLAGLTATTPALPAKHSRAVTK
jgi:AcrR family transcriptional regulator